MNFSAKDKRQLEIIARNLRELLNERGETQAEYAEAIGVTESAVGKWLLMHNAPSMGNMQRSARHFGVELSRIVDEQPLPQVPVTNNPDRDWVYKKLPDMTDEQVKRMRKLYEMIDDELQKE